MVPDTQSSVLRLGQFRVRLVSVEVTAVPEFISQGQLKATANIHSKHPEILDTGRKVHGHGENKPEPEMQRGPLDVSRDQC